MENAGQSETGCVRWDEQGPVHVSEGRERLLSRLLRELSHAKLLRALALDLQKRVPLLKES